MTKKNIFMVGLLVALGAVWAFFFSGWFHAEKIQIMHNLHAQRRRAGNNPEAVVTFGFNRAYQLVDVKVVSATALKTNSSPVPEWHVTSASNSVPLKMITYGQWIQGMKPAIPNTRPRPLLPGEKYHLSVKTTSGQEGDHEFTIPAAN